MKIEWSSREMSSFNRHWGMFKPDKKREEGYKNEETDEVKRGQRVKKEIRQNYWKANAKLKNSAATRAYIRTDIEDERISQKMVVAETKSE